MATKESTIDKGGFVENVANASLEPEEKKVRGQPFTYAELGGVLAQDVEDRKGFENGGSNTVSQWQFALEQQQPTELTPDEIKSEEHFQRIKDEPGLGENAPLIQTAAALYGLPRSTVSAYKGIRDARRLNKLQKSDLYHGGYGWQSGYYREGLQGEKLWRPQNIALWSTPSIDYAKYHANKRAQQLSSRTFDQHGKGASTIGVWQAKTSDINKFVILDRPSKQFKSQVKDEIIRLTNKIDDFEKTNIVNLNTGLFKPKAQTWKQPEPTSKVMEAYQNNRSTVNQLQHYLADPKKYKGTHSIGYKSSGQEPVLNLLKKHDYDGVVALEDLKIIMQGGPKTAQSQSQFVFLRRPELNKLSNEKVREMMDAAGFKKFYNEGGLVGEMDRLGFRKGGWLSKRRAARQHDIYEKGYSGFMNWVVDQFTPFGMLGNISNLSEIDADRFPRLHNLGIQAGKLYDTYGGATKEWLTVREGVQRDEGGQSNISINTDEDGWEWGSLLGRGKDRIAERRAKRRGARHLTTDAEIAAREERDAQRGAEIKQRIQAQSRARGDAMFQREAEALAGTNSGTEGSRGTRRVMFNEGSLVKIIDDLKTTYDSLSPEEASELQGLMGGRVGFADGTQPLTFNQQYHLDTIQDGSVLENIDGDPVTVNSIGITHNNKYYNVPSYDRHGGFFTAEEAKNKFLVDIELGFITGYNTSAEADNAAHEEHQMMNNDRDKALEAVGHRDTPWDHFLEGAKAGKKAFGFAKGGRVGFNEGELEEK